MRKVFWIILSLSLLIACDRNNAPEVQPTSEEIGDSLTSHIQLLEQANADYHFTTEQQWDSLNNISSKVMVHRPGEVHPEIRTFGWHLHTNGTAYKNYNFSMLWGISYFSYAVDPSTGSYRDIHQWKTTSLVDSAKAKGCKVFLSVSNFGGSNNAMLLKNPQARKTLVDSLSSLLSLRGADGVNLDFEGVLKENKSDFTKFIEEIAIGLRKDNAQLMISLCLYATDWNDVFDIVAIDQYIDFYTLMGYDYYGSFSKKTGPVTPFAQTEKFGSGLITSFNYYSNKGVLPSKLIIGLPYYGAEWHTEKAEIGSSVTKFKSHPTYKTIRHHYIDSLQLPIQFDTETSSSYIVLIDDVSGFRQIFFEDEKSLSLKYDWIKENNIGGVGIWALGYDDGYSDLWNLLHEKFAKPLPIEGQDHQ